MVEPKSAAEMPFDLRQRQEIYWDLLREWMQVRGITVPTMAELVSDLRDPLVRKS